MRSRRDTGKADAGSGQSARLSEMRANGPDDDPEHEDMDDDLITWDVDDLVQAEANLHALEATYDKYAEKRAQLQQGADRAAEQWKTLLDNMDERMKELRDTISRGWGHVQMRKNARERKPPVERPAVSLQIE